MIAVVVCCAVLQRTRDLGDPYGWIKVGRFDPVAQKCTLIFTKQTGSSVKQLIAGTQQPFFFVHFQIIHCLCRPEF